MALKFIEKDCNVQDKLYINGSWTSAALGETLAVYNPATQALIAQVAATTAQDIDAAVRAARTA